MGSMKITRRFHSCVELAKNDTTLLIDPGSFEVPDNLAEVDAVLVTHIHPDHVDAEALATAQRRNPGLTIYGPAELREHAEIDYTAVTDGDVFTVGDFDVSVHRWPHGTVTESTALPDNLGYLVDGRVLHTGDSFPDVDGVEVALVPVSAPWLKMLDVEAFLKASTPATFIGVHDGIDNDFGVALRKNLLTKLAEENGLNYLPLRPGDATEI